jgi:hypothetical protein
MTVSKSRRYKMAKLENLWTDSSQEAEGVCKDRRNDKKRRNA